MTYKYSQNEVECFKNLIRHIITFKLIRVNLKFLLFSSGIQVDTYSTLKIEKKTSSFPLKEINLTKSHIVIWCAPCDLHIVQRECIGSSPCYNIAFKFCNQVRRKVISWAHDTFHCSSCLWTQITEPGKQNWRQK